MKYFLYLCGLTLSILMAAFAGFMTGQLWGDLTTFEVAWVSLSLIPCLQIADTSKKFLSD